MSCVCPCGQIRLAEGRGKPGNGGLMMGAGSSTVSPNEQLLTKALIIVVGQGRGKSTRKLVNPQFGSSKSFVPISVPHHF